MKTKMFLSAFLVFILFPTIRLSNPTLQQDDSVFLLAPVSSGQTLTVIHGYNDPLPDEVCNIGTSSDHCLNQKYGLDLQPSNLSDNNILAPLPGVINWIGGDCLGMLTKDNLNLNVCHFQTVLVTLQQTVSRGQVLGTRSDNWIHLSLDDRYNQPTAPYPPIPFNGAHTIEGFSFDPGPDTTRNQWLNQVITSSNNVASSGGSFWIKISLVQQSIQKAWDSFWSSIVKK